MTERKKQGLFDRIIEILCVLILLVLAVRECSHLYRTPDSITRHGSLYEHHYIVSTKFPFIGAYFLMTPENYDPKISYPLTVILQGRSPFIYAADTLAQTEFRIRYPGFVLVPIAPVRSLWETPADKKYELPSYIKFPDAMPQVLDQMLQVTKEYNIDKSRMYLTGHSMGGAGVIGALQRYPEIFAAATALSGVWDPMDTREINTPLWIFHGAADRQISPLYSKQVAEALKVQGKTVQYNEVPDVEHDSWKIVYPNKIIWDWLFSHRR